MKKLLLLIILIAIGGLAYYGLSPLFKTKEVNDPLPSGATEEEKTMMESQGGFENLSEDEQSQMMEQMEEINSTGPVQTEDVMLTLEPTPERSEIMDTIGHPAEGTVRIIESNGETIIRFENFKTINGPRLHVYLAKDLDANEFIDLGPIRGTEGNINYVVPEGVDLSEYNYVMHWCVPFGVLFNFAKI